MQPGLLFCNFLVQIQLFPLKTSVCVYLDLVSVHACVGDQDIGVLQPLWLVHSNLLVQQETWTTHMITATNQREDPSLGKGGMTSHNAPSPSSR